MWYLIVSIPDLCTLYYFQKWGSTQDLNTNKDSGWPSLKHYQITVFAVKFVAKGNDIFMGTVKTGQIVIMSMLQSIIVGAHVIMFICNGSICYFHCQNNRPNHWKEKN